MLFSVQIIALTGAHFGEVEHVAFVVNRLSVCIGHINRS